jgi:hypothetical protein
MEKTTENISDKIYTRLVEMQDRHIELRKVFKFTVEKLQDEPQSCLREIEEYLKEHDDKIEDYWFQSYIDENTFEPHMVMNVVPNSHWRSMMQKNTLFENMLPRHLRVGILEKRVRDIMESYLFEMNSKETRHKMALDIEKAIFEPGKRLRVLDSTTEEEADSGGFSFIVKDEEEETSLKEYLVKVVSSKAKN